MMSRPFMDIVSRVRKVRRSASGALLCESRLNGGPVADSDWLAGAARLGCGFARRENVVAGAGVHDGPPAGVDRMCEVVGQQEVVFAGDAPLARFLRRLAAIIDADLRQRFVDDQRAAVSVDLQVDVAAAGMAG